MGHPSFIYCLWSPRRVVTKTDASGAILGVRIFLTRSLVVLRISATSPRTIYFLGRNHVQSWIGAQRRAAALDDQFGREETAGRAGRESRRKLVSDCRCAVDH